MNSQILLHFGSGALGLGMVIPTFCSGYFDPEIFVINRRDAKSLDRNNLLKNNLGFVLKEYGNTEEITYKISDFVYSDEDKKIKEIAKKDFTLFLTTSLKETGIEYQLDLISEIVQLRELGDFSTPLIVIAFENAITSEELNKKIKNKLGFTDFQKVIFLNCVVDRICNKPMIIGERIEIDVEKYKLLVIENRERILERLLDRSCYKQINSFKDTIIVDDIEFFINRKKWIVNAMHQLIAIFAHAYNFRSINFFVCTKHGGIILNQIGEEIHEVYLVNEPTARFQDTYDYMRSVKSRLKDFPSQVSTAITRLNNSSEIEAFIKDFNRKVGYPTKIYLEKKGRPLYWIPLCLVQFTEFISKKNYITQVQEKS